MKKKIQPKELIKPAIILVLVVVALVLSGNLNNYQLTVVNSALLYFIAASAITLMLGMGGNMSMCNITFVGMSAFFTARLSKDFGLNTVLAGLIAIAATSLIAYVLSFMMVRLTGYYFFFGTVGFCNMMATVFQNFKPLSNGPDGINGIPDLVLFGYQFKKMKDWCPLLIIVSILVILLIERIRKSSLGRSLMSIRDNPVAAQTLGVNLLRTKRIAFTIGAALAALSGTLMAYHNGVVSSLLFTGNVEQKLLMMVVLGGVNSTTGTLLGAFIMQLMPEVLRPVLEYTRLIQGILLVLMMIYMPMGIDGMFKSTISIWKQKRAEKKGGCADGAEENS